MKQLIIELAVSYIKNELLKKPNSKLSKFLRSDKFQVTLKESIKIIEDINRIYQN